MARRVRRQKLTSLSDIYKFFRHNQTPIYFLSPTPYNLLGLGRWINKFERSRLAALRDLKRKLEGDDDDKT